MIKKKKAEPIKEVKEMADLIHSDEGPLVVLFYNDSLTLAERLYDEGHRKALDVANEITELLEDYLYPKITEVLEGNLKDDSPTYTKDFILALVDRIQRKIAEKIKTKYTEDL